MEKTRKSIKRIIRSLSVLILLAVLFVSAVPVSAFETEDAPSVNAGTVAAAALDIVAAYTEINAEDVSPLENLQRDILNWLESYESLSQEEQALLSESMSYVQAIAAEIEDLQDAENAASRGENIDLEEDEAENSWRYLNGNPVTDVLEAISNEARSVPGWESDGNIPYSSQEETDYSDDGIVIIEGIDDFDEIVGSGVTYQGIDVSRHQGYIDWQQVKTPASILPSSGAAMGQILPARTMYAGSIMYQAVSLWEYLTEYISIRMPIIRRKSMEKCSMC